MPYFILCILPYISIPAFIFMLCRRVWVWIKLYNPAVMLFPGPGSVRSVWRRQYRPTIPLFPGIGGQGASRWVKDVKGFVFFTGLLKRDPLLWAGSWPYHVALLAVLLAHVRFVVTLPAPWFASPWVDWAAAMLFVSACYLTIRRFLVKRVREITRRRDRLAELLFLAAVGTGLALGGAGSVPAGAAQAYLVSVVTFSPAPIASDLFVAHMGAVYLLLLVFPSSHLLHAGGIFMSRRFLAAPDSLSGDIPTRPGR